MKKEKSYLQELSEYIKKNLRKGYTKESLKWALINQGHSRMEIDKALRFVDAELASEAPVLRTKPVIKYELVGADSVELPPKKSFWKRFFGF